MCKRARRTGNSKKIQKKMKVDTIYFQMLPGHRNFDIFEVFFEPYITVSNFKNEL